MNPRHFSINSISIFVSRCASGYFWFIETYVWNLFMKLCHDGGPCHVETSPLICRENQWTGFYKIGISVMKELIPACYLLYSNFWWKICYFMRKICYFNMSKNSLEIEWNNFQFNSSFEESGRQRKKLGRLGGSRRPRASWQSLSNWKSFLLLYIIHIIYVIFYFM